MSLNSLDFFPSQLNLVIYADTPNHGFQDKIIMKPSKCFSSLKASKIFNKEKMPEIVKRRFCE